MAEVKIESLKGNSHKEREETIPKKHVPEKVIKGEVITKKKGFFGKFQESFFGGDLETATDYVITDVIFPSIKRAISDMFANWIEMLLFGTSRGSNRRASSGGERVSYSSYFKSDGQTKPSITRNSKYDYRDVILASRGEAEEVLDTMREVISQYGQVTVADLYDIVGKTGDFVDNKYGWTDLGKASIRLVREGYLVDLPRAVPLD